MMRILRVVTRLNIGGPTRHVALLSSHLDRGRFQTLLIVGQPMGEEGNLTDEVRRTTHLRIVPELRRSVHPWRDFIAWWRLFIVLLRFQPDVVHTHMAKAGTLGRSAAWWYNLWQCVRGHARCRVVHTFHGHVLEGYFHPWVATIFTWIERVLARCTDVLIAVSPTIREELLRRGIGCASQIRVISLGLDLEPLATLEAGSDTGVLRCGIVGRLVPIKNPGVFVDALHHLIRDARGTTISGMVVGDGPLRAALEAETQSLGLADRVQFTGWQRDLKACYRDLDVVCLTSLNEGTPVALIEAMAAGRPVVATDVGGVRDLLDGPQTTQASIPAGGFLRVQRGILVRSGDGIGLAAALKVLAQDALLRRRLGGEGRAYVLQYHTTQRLMRAIGLLYDEWGQGEEVNQA